MIYSDIEVGHVYRSVQGTTCLCLYQKDYFDTGWIHWLILYEDERLSFEDDVWSRTSQFREEPIVREQYMRGREASWVKVA